MHDLDEMYFATKQIHAGSHQNEFRTLAAPIYQTATFFFESAEQAGGVFSGQEAGYAYSRSRNPTNTVIEEKMAMLEQGEAAKSFSSGMSAISSCLFALLKAGDHVIASKTLYGSTYSLLEHGFARYGIETSFVDTRDPENVKAVLKPNTKVVFLESPANPNMYLADIKAISDIAHTIEGCKVVVDNTYCTPYLQTPLTLGADLVVHSATKYLNGHGDVIAGFAIGSLDLIQQVRSFGMKMTGSVLGPFEAFLINRGLKTLDIRMEKHCSNALKVANFLEKHPKIANIAYPGLKSFTQYELAQRQMKLPGGIIAFELKGGMQAGKNLLNHVKLCIVAVSLGDTETLIQHAASMTHASYSPEEIVTSGISEGLIRISVGIENPEDIIADLEQALSFC